MTQFIDTRVIPLPKGGTLEVQVTQEFLDRIRKQFMLSTDQEVTDDHIRMFFYGSVNQALTNHEGSET